MPSNCPKNWLACLVQCLTPTGHSLLFDPLSPHPFVPPLQVSAPCSPVPSSLSLGHHQTSKSHSSPQAEAPRPQNKRRVWLFPRAGFPCGPPCLFPDGYPTRSGPEPAGLRHQPHRPPFIASDLSSESTWEKRPKAGRPNSHVWLQSKICIHS